MAGFDGLVAWLNVPVTVFGLFALIDAFIRREDAFRAAGKQTKPFWLIILAIALVVSLIFPLLSFLPIIGLIAIIVYFVDVRPAIKQVGGGGGGRGLRGGSSSDGPYGPYNGGR
ncbi:DUF2516 family protein [Streptomyces sp. NBC_01498]|uniref:DUF2516 family protein n=1 Tax=Streptomyces sp. NBC_01498 TaxID=2975870 RepID=UPI002E7B9D97|nr:DUF2516 family protein [Streptomyces sp. NBC_01498]WTL28859.1 DUF2516 family protein [Streptomyces sp. NBC_01498]